MAYKIKTTKQFQKDLKTYLEEHPLEVDYEENLIDNFSSSNLSDLYKLFLDLKNINLNEKLYTKLKTILQKRFEINADIICEGKNSAKMISSESIHSLEVLIKDKYLNYLSNSENVDKNELYKLSVIVNKIFPDIFLSLIKNPNSDIQKQQDFIKKNILSTVNLWHSHNTKDAEEENRDIMSALYITIQKLYPDLKTYIPGRVKSMKSSLSNINKELTKSISSIVPSDISVGITNEDLEKQFSLENANTDFSGLTIVLDNTDDVLHLDNSHPATPKILQLRKKRFQDINFIHSLENCLDENAENYFTDTELLQIKIDLLTRLRECTYSECREEFQGTSFNKLLKEAIQEYTETVNNPNINNTTYDDSKYFLTLDKIDILLEELKKRVHDKYQTKILEMVVPDILEDETFTQILKIKSNFLKSVKKKNGFCSSYYLLETPTGRKIELQVQSRMRFKDSKDGSSDHSKLPNKTINISHFFEPANPNCDNLQYEYLFNILNTTTITERNFLNTTPDAQLSPREKRLKRKLKIAEQNIKLKDNVEFENKTPDGTTKIDIIPIETYLPLFAEYVSPKLMSVSSHHTRFNKSVAAYNKKSLASCFREVLLKNDSTTCLAQQLIDKLEDILPNDKNEVSLNGIATRAALRQQKNQNADCIEH